MAHVALFHSVLGLRPMELRAAERLRLAGHHVVTPDLYRGRRACALDEGFQVMNEVGWSTLVQRAHQAVEGLPAHAVLAGVSMGTGVVGALLPHRPAAAGVLFLHAVADLPRNVRRGLPVDVHVADPDDFAPPGRIAEWLRTTVEAGSKARVFTYPGAGHFYTDPSLSDHDERASTLTWQRILDFLAAEPTSA